jgi:hypothetical protein
MADQPVSPTDVSRLTAELKDRAAKERASGGYPDDLSGLALETPATVVSGSITEGFDLQSGGPRVRFRPELGFSTKPVIGPVITLVKRFYLRLLFYVFDDLARQTDTAIGRIETALAVEIAARERLERETADKIRELEGEIQMLRARAEGQRQ